MLRILLTSSKARRRYDPGKHDRVDVEWRRGERRPHPTLVRFELPPRLSCERRAQQLYENMRAVAPDDVIFSFWDTSRQSAS